MSLLCKSRVELFIGAQGLVGVLGCACPLMLLTDMSEMVDIAETPHQHDQPNPVFSPVQVNYFADKIQTFIVEFSDYSKNGNHMSIGTQMFTLKQVLDSEQRMLCLPLNCGSGVVTIIAVPQDAVEGILDVQLCGKALRNMDTFSKSDPFYVIERILPGGGVQEIFRSEVIDDDLNPQWMPRCLDAQLLCSGDLDAKVLKFTCYDEDLTENEYMGEFVCSVQDLLKPAAEFTLTNPKNPSESFGTICLSTATFNQQPGFLDLLKGGLQLNVAFSLDFTGSNLECTNPKSLHYYHPTQPNQYVQAMLAVSDVVQEYDSDRQFPAFGFGAVIPGSHEANHFFNLSLGPTPYIPGMQAVIDTYVGTLKKVRLYGPTNFAPTIRNVATGARQAEGVYTILLIMTDGEITDMDDTITEIVNADDAPFSILIVGVGNADFVSMEQLDCDNGALRASTGRVARRDIVQFVPMRDFAQRSHAELAAALLAEIPDQVSKWAMMNPAASQRFFTPQAVVLPPAAAVA